MNLFPEPTYEQVVLERLKVGMQGRIPHYVLANLEMSTWADHLTRDLTYRFSSEVLAQALDRRTVDQRVEWEAPASWWQMLKATHESSWWLGWLVSRRPVRTVTHHKFATIHVAKYAAYPGAQVALPKDQFGSAMIVNRVVE